MAQRMLEMVIGRLITDEQFRAEFLADPGKTLKSLCDYGFELSGVEMAALVNTDPGLWVNAAERLDPRLQKASFSNDASAS